MWILTVFASVQGGRHSVTDDTLTLQVEHLVLFEVTIATTTQQDRMSIMLISS